MVRREPIWRRRACLALLTGLCFTTACGRVGVELLPLGAGTAGGALRDAAVAGASDAAGIGAGSLADAGLVSDAGCQGLCSIPNGAADCSTGSCSLSCINGYADCDGVTSNGCEVGVAMSVSDCGGCTRGCSNAHGASSCVAGLCRAACATGYADCDSNAVNGCETSLTEVDHCGGCGTVCSNVHGTSSCVAGSCTPSCATGYADCDGNAANGCETSLVGDPAHCGSCAKRCNTPSEVCSAGKCALSPCSAGRGECDGGGAQACETDLTSSATNCGFCGNVCSAANGVAMCMASSCALRSCDAAHADCDLAYANGCEVTLASDVGHCGACDVACGNAHGATSCVGGSCVPSCSSGYGDCDGDVRNGCEATLDTVSDCGMCGKTCPANGGTPVCNAGVCSTSCDLTGSFAFKLSAPVSWPSSTVLSAGNGMFVFWGRVELTQSGNNFSGTLTPCGELVPDFSASPIVNEKYGVAVPGTAFDNNPPSTLLLGNLAATAPGSGLTLQRSAWLVGASLSDPVNNAWPSRAATMQVDTDADGKVGITGSYKSGNGFSAVPVNTFGTARASRGYFSTRAVFALNGTLSSCTQSSGTATVSSVESNTLGCRLTSGSDCSTAQADYLNNNRPSFQPKAASYVLTKLTGAATCADVRAALP